MNRSVLFLIALVVCARASIAGPPTLCHPIDIGGARSLPVGEGTLEAGDLPLTELASETVRLLDAADDALVHMETLRRAGLYLLRADDEEGRRHAHALVELLEDRVLSAEARDDRTTAHARALRWFDLGYFGAVRAEAIGVDDPLRFGRLEKAARLADDDPAIHFGVANAGALDREHRARFLRHLHAALTRAPDGSRVAVLVQRLVARVESSMSGETREELIESLELVLDARAVGSDDDS